MGQTHRIHNDVILHQVVLATLNIDPDAAAAHDNVAAYVAVAGEVVHIDAMRITLRFIIHPDTVR